MRCLAGALVEVGQGVGEAQVVLLRALGGLGHHHEHHDGVVEPPLVGEGAGGDDAALGHELGAGAGGTQLVPQLLDLVVLPERPVAVGEDRVLLDALGLGPEHLELTLGLGPAPEPVQRQAVQFAHRRGAGSLFGERAQAAAGILVALARRKASVASFRRASKRSTRLAGTARLIPPSSWASSGAASSLVRRGRRAPSDRAPPVQATCLGRTGPIRRAAAPDGLLGLVAHLALVDPLIGLPGHAVGVASPPLAPRWSRPADRQRVGRRLAHGPAGAAPAPGRPSATDHARPPRPAATHPVLRPPRGPRPGPPGASSPPEPPSPSPRGRARQPIVEGGRPPALRSPPPPRAGRSPRSSRSPPWSRLCGRPRRHPPRPPAPPAPRRPSRPPAPPAPPPYATALTPARGVERRPRLRPAAATGASRAAAPRGASPAARAPDPASPSVARSAPHHGAPARCPRWPALRPYAGAAVVRRRGPGRPSPRRLPPWDRGGAMRSKPTFAPGKVRPTGTRSNGKKKREEGRP